MTVVVLGVLAGVGTVTAVAVAWLLTGPGDDRGPTAQAPAVAGHDDTVVEADARALADGYAVWDRGPDGTPTRWDPCTPIELVVSTVGAPESLDVAAWRRDVEQAATTIAEASGLPLRVSAETEDRPAADRGTLGATGWAPVLIGWADPTTTDLPLRDTDRAIAVPVAVRDGDGGAVFVTGQVVLNRDRDDLRPGREDRADTWGAVLVHELAHLVGLDHVDDPAQLMYRYPGEGPVELGVGDRAGLAALGADAGCVDVPVPTDLEVSIPDR